MVNLKGLKQKLGKELLFTVITVVFFVVTFTVLPPNRKTSIELPFDEWGIFTYQFERLLIPILFGMILGLRALITRWNSHSGFHWIRLVLQGLPALILLFPFAIFVAFHFVNLFGIDSLSIPIGWAFWVKYPDNNLIFHLAGVWFGKALIDSVKGKQLIQETEIFD